MEGLRWSLMVGLNLLCLRRILKASRTHWQAAAWFSERKYPDEWGSERKRLRDLEKQFKAIVEEMEAIKARRPRPYVPPETPINEA